MKHNIQKAHVPHAVRMISISLSILSVLIRTISVLITIFFCMWILLFVYMWTVAESDESKIFACWIKIRFIGFLGSWTLSEQGKPMDVRSCMGSRQQSWWHLYRYSIESIRFNRRTGRILLPNGTVQRGMRSYRSWRMRFPKGKSITWSRTSITWPRLSSEFLMRNQPYHCTFLQLTSFNHYL